MSTQNTSSPTQKFTFWPVGERDLGAGDDMCHDGRSGVAGKAELLTAIEGMSSRPVRRIVREG
jgi:hypothetical protein